MQNNTKKIIGDLEVTGEIIAKKQQEKYKKHKHNIHTSVTIPVTRVFINQETPHKLMVQSQIQTININGETTASIENAEYNTRTAETFKTADGYKMTVEER